MRRLVVLIIVIEVVGAAILFFVFRGEEFVDVPRSGTNIIFFGDSLVEGVGATQGNDLASLLSRELGVPIINAGRSGDTSATARARLESDVLAKDPRIVIVLFGGNDSLRKIEPETTFANLRMIVDTIHAKGAAVLLVGIRGPFFGSQYDREFKNLAQEARVSFVPDILDGIAGRPSLMSDLIHPNDSGYAILAGRIAPPLQMMLK